MGGVHTMPTSSASFTIARAWFLLRPPSPPRLLRLSRPLRSNHVHLVRLVRLIITPLNCANCANLVQTTSTKHTRTKLCKSLILNVVHVVRTSCAPRSWCKPLILKRCSRCSRCSCQIIGRREMSFELFRLR